MGDWGGGGMIYTVLLSTRWQQGPCRERRFYHALLERFYKPNGSKFPDFQVVIPTPIENCPVITYARSSVNMMAARVTIRWLFLPSPAEIPLPSRARVILILCALDRGYVWLLVTCAKVVPRVPSVLCRFFWRDTSLALGSLEAYQCTYV